MIKWCLFQMYTDYLYKRQVKLYINSNLKDDYVRQDNKNITENSKSLLDPAPNWWYVYFSHRRWLSRRHMIRVFNSSYGIQNEWVMQNCVMHNMATETKQQNMKYILATHAYIHTHTHTPHTNRYWAIITWKYRRMATVTVSNNTIKPCQVHGKNHAYYEHMLHCLETDASVTVIIIFASFVIVVWLRHNVPLYVRLTLTLPSRVFRFCLMRIVSKEYCHKFRHSFIVLKFSV